MLHGGRNGLHPFLGGLGAGCTYKGGPWLVILGLQWPRQWVCRRGQASDFRRSQRDLEPSSRYGPVSASYRGRRHAVSMWQPWGGAGAVAARCGVEDWVIRYLNQISGLRGFGAGLLLSKY